MLSLGNTYSLDELHEFIARIEREAGETELVAELKFDGTAISLTYEHGLLVQALTRGDGTRGDDVTANVRTIRSVPLRLRGDDWPELFEIRGEILLPYASFDRLNAEREQNGEPPFANPRNAAAGTLKQQASAVVARRGLDCTLYQLAGENLPFETHWESLVKAREWGFKISDAMRICRGAGEVDDYIRFWDQARKGLPFATDGVVIKVNSFAVRRSLGFTSKAPKWAVAYKFKAEQALTRIESIDFQVGRTGAVTPVANLDPVLLAGTTVKRATLHNAEQIAQMNVRVGFTPAQAGSIGIIGGADGPTAIFLTARLAPELLGPIAVAAYSYMALVPVIQPPIMRLLTTKKEREIKMSQLRPVSKTEKILFPIIIAVIISLLLPSAAPLIGCLMLGNLMKECGVVDRLSKTVQNELMNIVVIFLGITVGATATAEAFINVQTLSILVLGVLAFALGTAGGLLLAKFMNLFLPEGKKMNPLIGSAGVSAVPMAARVSQTVGQEANPSNFLLMHAMGPNVAGVVGSAVAAGILLSFLG